MKNTAFILKIDTYIYVFIFNELATGIKKGGKDHFQGEFRGPLKN